MMTSLTDRRGVVAERVYQEFDFGAMVNGTDGWEFGWDHDDPDGREVRRVVYLASEDGAESQKIHFVVRFHPGTDAVDEAYISD